MLFLCARLYRMRFLLMRLTIFYHAYRRKIFRAVVLFFFLGSGFLLIDVPRWADGHARLFVLDVGQGDALLLRSGNGENVLVDGGPDNTVLQELGTVLPLFERTIDVVVLTHPDADHLNGLVNVLERYRIGCVVLTGVAKKSAVYQKFLLVMKERHIPTVFVNTPYGFTVDDLSFTVIWPLHSFVGRIVESVNDTSIVLRVDGEKKSVLLTGDISEAAENRLVAQEASLLDVDILKIPHHGSKTSSSMDFLNAVSPEITLISAGEGNRYHHPTKETLDRIAKTGASIRRTDLEGRIEMVLD